MFISKKIYIYTFLLTLCYFCVTSPAQAYYVSGVVDFSYSSTSIRTHSNSTTSSYWTEHYGISAGSFIYDPRLFRWNAKVDFFKSHADGSADTDRLDYSISTNFFPGRPISWDVYAARGNTKIESTGNIAGYDVETTSYGAALGLRLSSFRRRPGNNNYDNSGNNNSVNYNNRISYFLPLPDIFLSTIHYESESKDLAFPVREQRDDNAANIRYSLGSLVNLDFNAKTENYENEINGSGYDTTSLNLIATSNVTSNGELRLTGDSYERETHGIPGVQDSSIRRTIYTARLNFRPTGKLSHSYQYSYTRLISGVSEYLSQGANAELQYDYLPDLAFRGGAAYSDSEYITPATATSNAAHYTKQDGRLYVGAQYRKVYSPDFLDPFTFSTGYDLASGYSKATDELTGQDGSGRYYQNNVTLGFRSTGWKREMVNLDYALVSRRDHSPVSNDYRSETFTLGLLSTRLPRTTINANGIYQSVRNSSGILTDAFQNFPANSTQSNRTLQYNASLDHAATSYLTLNAGASRGRSKLRADYTLANIASDSDTTDTLVYAGATLNYQFTRNLSCRALAREEMRRQEPGNGNDATAYIVTAALNYRIRKIIVNAEYRWREDIRENLYRVWQQYIFAKVTRPF